MEERKYFCSYIHISLLIFLKVSLAPRLFYKYIKIYFINISYHYYYPGSAQESLRKGVEVPHDVRVQLGLNTSKTSMVTSRTVSEALTHPEAF